MRWFTAATLSRSSAPKPTATRGTAMLMVLSDSEHCLVGNDDDDPVH